VEGLTVKRILGLLGWLGVVLVLAAVALRFIKPELQQWYQGLALAGLVVTALYALSQWRDIGRSFQGRNVRYGSMTAGSVLLFLGILVGINWISSRQNKRWDLTAAQQFSLSDQTKKILGELTKPVVMRVFHDSGAAQQYRDQLAGYAYQSKQVSIEYIDAVAHPTEAQQYDIQTVPTIVIAYDGRTERASAADEQTVTNALKKVIEGKAKKVYFIQGHGEHDPTGSDPAGYSGVADSLKNDNFDVEKLTLAQAGAVPADATLVVVAGPKTDYLSAEVDAIKAFLKTGGKLLMMIDPPDKADATQPTSLITLAHDWGMDVGDNMVVDASGLGQLIGTDASVPIAMPAPHPITDQFKLMTAFPITRSVTPITGGVDGHVAQKLLETSPQSWAESDIKGLYATGRPERNFDKGDVAGPITIADAVSATATDAPAPASPDLPKPETRMVVVGDSDFASNRALNIQGNRDLFLNMANWLAQQENMIAIRPRDPENRGVTLTEDQSQRIFWLTIFIIPGLLFANAIRVWWRRR
jgi:gliding motility-associatede transport system auxiliary component